MFQLGLIGGADPVLPEPSGSPLGDALSAVAAAAHAAITGHGFTRADLWPLLGRYGLARHLAPARAAAHRRPAGRPARAPACPRPRRDTHHDHDAAASAARRDTVSSTPPP